MAVSEVRASLRGLMGATAKNEPNWHYKLARPLVMPTRDQALTGVVEADCSFGCSILCHLAGAPDPTADNWQGNSTSMFQHLPHIPFGEVKVGDIGVFGHTDGEQHAVMAYQTAPTENATLVWSHGQEAGPIIVPAATEKGAHPGATLTWLRAVPADPNPAPHPETRVDVTKNGRGWLKAQRLSNPAVWVRIKQAARTAKNITIRRAN